MHYTKPLKCNYWIAQAVSWVVSKLIFRNKVLRNEIKNAQGPFVVIANHQCAYDFVNLICATRRPMSFVISQSFFNSLPIKGFLHKMGVIPKQQFQTTVADMKRMKAVIDHGQPLVIYPAGLMCEDGLSTPIPSATYKFLKWLGVDVYVARTVGSYFVMPKWSKGMRPGKTTIDIYKLFSKEELADISIDAVKAATDEALLFDAYRDQNADPQIFRNGSDIAGLQNVLYRCPECGQEFTISAPDSHTLRCSACGYSQHSDQYGFLHNDGHGPEIRYISDWSRLIFEDFKQTLRKNPEYSVSVETDIHILCDNKPKFVPAGHGLLTVSTAGITLSGQLNAEALSIHVPIGSVPTLPFSPGRYLEVQHGSDIYRCVLHDGRLVMKLINMVKILYELRCEDPTLFACCVSKKDCSANQD